MLAVEMDPLPAVSAKSCLDTKLVAHVESTLGNGHIVHAYFPFLRNVITPLLWRTIEEFLSHLSSRKPVLLLNNWEDLFIYFHGFGKFGILVSHLVLPVRKFRAKSTVIHS
jgi:hypothetical protein